MKNLFEIILLITSIYRLKKIIFNLVVSSLYLRTKGGLAHLVERKHGMFEVIGSSPISST